MNTTPNTTTQQGGIGQKLHNMLHHNKADTNLNNATALAPGSTYTSTQEVYTIPATTSSGFGSISSSSSPTFVGAPLTDSSLRSTTLPVHTNPGSPIYSQGLSQGGFSMINQTSPILNQGFVNQSSPIPQQGFVTQSSPILNQGGLINQTSPVLNQGGLLGQGGSPMLNQGLAGQTGIPAHGGIFHHHQGQTALNQGVFHQGPQASDLLTQGGIAPMHTAAGHSTLPVGGQAYHAAPIHNAAPIHHQQPLLVNKKLRSTISVVETPILQQQPFVQQQQFIPQQQHFVQQRGLAIQQQIPTETVVRPTIVEEVQRSERVVEVQPIIHREVEAPEVRVIEQHIYESVPSSGPSVINKTAIVEETIRPRIIEEVQNIVHREVPQPFIERVEQHVTEKITQPTVMTKEVINDRQQQFLPAGGFSQAGGAPLVAPATSNISSSSIRRDIDM